MAQAQEPVNGTRKVREGVAVFVAAIVLIGISAAVVYMMVAGTVTAEAGFAFLGPIAGGAGTWLWNKQAAKDAKDAALARPDGRTGSGGTD